MSRSKIQLGHNLPILTLHLPTVKVSKFQKQISCPHLNQKKPNETIFLIKSLQGFGVRQYTKKLLQRFETSFDIKMMMKIYFLQCQKVLLILKLYQTNNILHSHHQDIPKLVWLKNLSSRTNLNLFSANLVKCVINVLIKQRG